MNIQKQHPYGLSFYLIILGIGILLFFAATFGHTGNPRVLSQTEFSVGLYLLSAFFVFGGGACLIAYFQEKTEKRKRESIKIWCS